MTRRAIKIAEIDDRHCRRDGDQKSQVEPNGFISIGHGGEQFQIKLNGVPGEDAGSVQRLAQQWLLLSGTAARSEKISINLGLASTAIAQLTPRYSLLFQDEREF